MRAATGYALQVAVFKDHWVVRREIVIQMKGADGAEADPKVLYGFVSIQQQRAHGAEGIVVPEGVAEGRKPSGRQDGVIVEKK